MASNTEACDEEEEDLKEGDDNEEDNEEGERFLVNPTAVPAAELELEDDVDGDPPDVVADDRSMRPT